MGESSRNYQNGKIYCIRNNIDGDIYILVQPLNLYQKGWHGIDNRPEKNRRKITNYIRKWMKLGLIIFIKGSLVRNFRSYEQLDSLVKW